ncbi:MAG: CRTAC1 family protein [Planctomycetes bacterium]|nr:CRTAC1 family protein [Planctomycetota bacterium]
MRRRSLHVCGFVCAMAVGCTRREPGVPPQPPAPESAAPASAPAPTAPPSHRIGHFIDATREAGVAIELIRGRPSPNQRFLLETKGGGGAWIDYDRDGRIDIYLINGNDPSSKGPQPHNYLLRNRGDGTFEDVTERAGVGCDRYGYGVAVGDFDNDGADDIFISNHRCDRLYRNNGDGTFTDATEEADVGDPFWGASTAFADIDNDGFLDLYVTNYFVLDIDDPPHGGALCLFNEILAPCGPIGMVPEPDFLYANDGDGTFTDISRTSGIRSVPNAYGLGVIFRDLDGDGFQDIYVANDMNPNRLFRNRGDRTFEEIGIPSGCSLSEVGAEQAGMGIDAADTDGDGWQEILVGNYTSEDCGYYRNDTAEVGALFFTHLSQQVGIGGTTYLPLTFGAKFFDAENDGDLDIFFANGHVHPNVEGRQVMGFAQLNFLFIQVGKHRFEEESARRGSGLAVRKVSRAAAAGDYDDDGALDILVINLNDTPTLLRNGHPGADAHWIEIETVGRASNRNGIGAKITVEAGGKRWFREVHRDGSYCAAQDPRTHVGLGAIGAVDRISVVWPRGRRQSVENIPVDRVIRIVEAKS